MGMHIFYEHKMAALGQQFKHLPQNLFSDHEGAELDTVLEVSERKRRLFRACVQTYFFLLQCIGSGSWI
jgi:hypothetical protein